MKIMNQYWRWPHKNPWSKHKINVNYKRVWRKWTDQGPQRSGGVETSAGILLFISENRVLRSFWVSAINSSAYEFSWDRYSIKSGSLVFRIQWYGSSQVLPWTDTVKGTFFGEGVVGVVWVWVWEGDDTGWNLLQREEKREWEEENVFGNKRKVRDKVVFLIVLGFRREAAMANRSLEPLRVHGGLFPSLRAI